MKSLFLCTFTLGCSLLIGCGGPPGPTSAALTTIYAEHEITSEQTADGNIHTSITRLSDAAEVATLDWSAETHQTRYQSVAGASQTFVTNETQPLSALAVEHEFAAALIGDAQSKGPARAALADGRRIEDRAAAPGCHVVTYASPDWSCVWECATCNGQDRGCTEYGACTL